MTTTQPRKLTAKKTVAAPPVKPEPPTAMHREAPFGKDGGALYFNSVTDRWYAHARIIDPETGLARPKTAATRSRDAAYEALVALRAEHTLSVRGRHEEEPAPAAPVKPAAKRSAKPKTNSRQSK